MLNLTNHINFLIVSGVTRYGKTIEEAINESVGNVTSMLTSVARTFGILVVVYYGLCYLASGGEERATRKFITSILCVGVGLLAITFAPTIVDSIQSMGGAIA